MKEPLIYIRHLWAVWMVVEKILPELKKDIRSIIDQENRN